MSSENTLNNQSVKTATDNILGRVNETGLDKVKKVVDINNLMLRVREEERKQRTEILIFLSLVTCLIVIVGIIASL